MEVERPNGKPLVVLVHGTEDGPMPSTACAQSPFELNRDPTHQLGDRWWQSKGKARKFLARTLRLADGSQPEIIGFCWSGANLEDERRTAAVALHLFLRTFVDAGRRIHIVAHSFGGEVVRGALSHLETERLLALMRSKKFSHQPIISVTMVGTPFLVRAHGRDWTRSRRYLSTTGFSAAAVGSILYVTLTQPSLHFDSWLDVVRFAVWSMPISFGMAGGVVAAVKMQKYWSRSGFDGLRGYDYIAFTKHHDQPNIESVYLESDEAIFALSALNSDLNVFVPDDGRRLDRFNAISGALLALFCAVPVGIVFLRDQSILTTSLRHLALASGATVLTFVLITALIFWGGRLVSKLFSHISALLLNRSVSSRLRALALGDTDRGVVGVKVEGIAINAAAGSQFEAIRLAIESDVAAAAATFYADFRRKMSLTAPDLQKHFLELVRTSLTWRELAHTSYLTNDLFLEYLARDRLAATGDFAYLPQK